MSLLSLAGCASRDGAVFASPPDCGAKFSSDVMAGAPAGSTVHADLWNTWDQPTLERLVDRCINTGPNCVFRDA